MKRADLRKIVSKSILWAARVWGTFILAFVLFFLMASIFGEWGEVLRNPRELLVFLMFPCSTVVGLSIALRREGLGGLVTTIGMLIAFILRPDLIRQPFFSVGVLGPGILYLVSWALARTAQVDPDANREVHS